MSTTKKLIIAGVILVVVIGAAGLWWFLQDEAPAEVSLSGAEKSVTTVAGETDTFDGDAAGTWTVDTSQGEFDFESATGTFAGFRIDEELSTIGSTTAVGRTGDVEGTVTIEGTELTETEVTVDLTTITTDQSRRDTKVQAALDTGQFPTATFNLTEPIDLGDAVTTGDETSVTATGDLTVHGITKPVEIELDAKIKGSTLIVVGSVDVALSDFGIEAPSAPIVVSVADDATIEFQLLLARN